MVHRWNQRRFSAENTRTKRVFSLDENHFVATKNCHHKNDAHERGRWKGLSQIDQTRSEGNADEHEDGLIETE